MSESPPAVLDQSSRVSVRLVLMIVVPMFGAAAWIKDSIDEVNYRLAAIEESLSDVWTVTDMKHWVEMFKAQNPDAYVPEVD